MSLKEIKGSSLKVSRKFVDIGIGLKRNTVTNDAGVVKNDNSIKQAIRNIVLTNPGEKPFQPLKGCRVRQMLFEQLDPFTADAIRDDIINTINQYEPRVSLSDVNVQPYPGGNKLHITVTYRITGIPLVESVSFVLQRPE